MGKKKEIYFLSVSINSFPHSLSYFLHIFIPFFITFITITNLHNYHFTNFVIFCSLKHQTFNVNPSVPLLMLKKRFLISSHYL